jgi:hypothetical protein
MRTLNMLSDSLLGINENGEIHDILFMY